MSKVHDAIDRLSPEQMDRLFRRLRGRATRPAAARAIPRRSEAAPAPGSFAQERLWFLHQIGPRAATYNIAGAVDLDGALDLGALVWSLGRTVARHEALRTTLALVDEQLVQVVHPPAGIELPLVDLGALPTEVAQRCGRELATAAARSPFDLERGPLLRLTLLRYGARRHRLLLVVHHAVADDRSVTILVDEMVSLYRARTGADAATPLPALPVQYGDFAAWQRQRAAGGEMDGQLDYWRRRLDGLPDLDLPTDRPRPARPTSEGGRRPVSLPEPVVAGLRRLCEERGLTSFMVLLAVWAVLLGRSARQDDVAVAVPASQRDRDELNDLIGLFVNTVLMRIDLAGGPPFLDLLGRVRTVAAEAFSHRDLPFERLVHELAPHRHLGATPLARVMLSQESAPAELRLPGLDLRFEDLPTGTAKFDLLLALRPAADGSLRGYVEYDADLFDATTVDRLAHRFERLSAGAVTAPATPLSRLPWLSAAERQQVLVEFNRWGRRGLPVATLVERFAARAAERPRAEAVVAGGGRTTYGELAARVGRLAHLLRRRGVGMETPVAVCLERSAELPVALLAVLAAGGAYVPLDPAYPARRIAFILADSGASVVLTQRSVSPRLPAVEGARVLELDALAEELAAQPAVLPEAAASPSSLAYVIYTSGSTGRPKGVAIEHRSATALVDWSALTFGGDELAGVLASTSVCFDLSVFELLVPLCLGGRVILAENSLELPDLPAAGEVTMVNTVPSAMAELLRLDALPPGVRTVNLAGEPLLRPLADGVLSRSGVERLLNLYGPSEDTTYSTIAEVPRGAAAPTIGRPVEATRAYVVDRHLGLQPPGVPGELCLAGRGLARGYLARPSLTAGSFVPDPFAGRAGARLYRTGDLARWLGDGELEFLGRLDHQVKVRGFRIELGEVTAALDALDGVREAAVVVRPEPSGASRLVAYVVGEVDDGELRRGLRGRLPEYMVPSLFVHLQQLPRTPNGKLDRQALPQPAAGRAAAEASYRPPETPAQQRVAAVWRDLLGVERVGVDDDFFELGGHSLLATRLVSRLRDAFSLPLPLRAVFETPTVAGLAERLTDGTTCDEAAPAAVRPRPGGGDAPLSFAQERLWFLDRFEAGGGTLNMLTALRLRGPLHRDALARAFRRTVERQAVLRTTFVGGGRPRQVVGPPAAVPLPTVDLGGLDEVVREAELERRLAAEAARPFDLESGPPMRVALVRLGAGHHVLLLNLHHIVCDGWSLGVMVRELGALYTDELSHRPASLPALPVQYADYALWQRRRAESPELAAQTEHWRRQLAGAPAALELPTDRPRPAVQTYRGDRVRLLLEADLVARLDTVGRDLGATRFMVMLAVFAGLLSRHAGQRDLVVGTPVAGRVRPELEGLVGVFLNSLPLRIDLCGAPSFAELVQRVRGVAVAAYANQDVPFERLLAELAPDRDLSRTPIFQVFFNMLNFPLDRVDLPGLDSELLTLPEVPSKFDLTVYVEDRAGGDLQVDLVYNADLFDAARIEDLGRQYRLLLAACAAAPEDRMEDVSLLTPRARRSLPDPTRPLDDSWAGSVHGLFSTWAARQPERPAVIDPVGEVTYGQLDEWSDRLAGHLAAAGVGRGDRVAIHAHRSAPLVWAVVAVLKAGGAFVMLDPAYPARRNSEYLRGAAPRAFLEIAAAGPPAAELEEWIAAAGPVCRVRLESRPDGSGAWERREARPPEVDVGPEDLAYVAFTSGSTGRPKGILGRHGPLSHFLPWQCRVFDLGPEDRFSMLSGLAHDPLQRDLFTPLQIGAAVVAPDVDDVFEAGRLARWMAARRITVTHLTPAMGQVLLRGGGDATRLPDLRWAFFVGDVLTRGDVGRLRRLAPQVRVVNYFGSTETQRAVGHHLVEAGEAVAGGDRDKQVLPLGRGGDGVQLLVLNGHRQAGIGEVGEVCVRSPHLARGYQDDPRGTAARFVPDPGGNPGGRSYRTGDLGRYRPDGEVTFLGRADQQVKIRGFRVEPGEVQAVLGSLPGVREAVVLPRPDARGETALVAWVVPADGAEAEAETWRRELERRLPASMIPSVYVSLDELPLTPNGKLDRGRLPEPEAERSARPVTAPRTALESTIADVWRQVLRVERVGVEDNFFDLGGHSLLLLEVHDELQRRLDRRFPVVELFRSPTVASLAQAMSRQDDGEDRMADRRQRAQRKREAIERRRRAVGRTRES